MKLQILVLMIYVLLNITSCKDNPVDAKPNNRNSIILSLTVFPDTVGLRDSVIVICNAIDPDGDTLVYDWITDSRLKIKGAFANETWLYHTYENSRVFYPNNVNIPLDSAWVQCMVRDVKGGQVGKVIRLFIKSPLKN